MRAFGIEINQNLTETDLHFDEVSGGSSEKFYVGKETISAYLDNDQKVALRPVICAFDFKDATGEMIDGDKTHVVTLELCPNLEDLTDKQKADYARSACVDVKDVEYYDVYTYGHSVKCLEQACKESEVESLVQFASNCVELINMMVGFYLDKPVNLAGETGWNNVERWYK